MSKKSQLEKIRRHLMRGKSITPLTALLRYDCFRLGARIWDLRHKFGIPIITEQPMAIFGKPYARYRIDPEWLRKHREEDRE